MKLAFGQDICTPMFTGSTAHNGKIDIQPQYCENKQSVLANTHPRAPHNCSHLKGENPSTCDNIDERGRH